MEYKFEQINLSKIFGTGEALAFPPLPSAIPHGDMPGDKVNIDEGHIKKAAVIFPKLCEELKTTLAESPYKRAAITVCGGSGVGKSEIASLLSYYLRSNNIGSYTLSGDNYPRRIPQYNDAERLRIFRSSGVRGLITSGRYTAEIAEILKSMQKAEIDAAPELVAEKPWLRDYQSEGRKGLKSYLGTPNEIDFAELTDIVSQFKNGAAGIWLKRLGREVEELWYSKVDLSDVNVLVIEWTHGNSDWYQGVDIPILLRSTPAETLAYRKLRNRDGKTDSPFTTMVLEIEQDLLEAQAHKAKIIVLKSGELLETIARPQFVEKQQEGK